jgi:hypothetical protein
MTSCHQFVSTKATLLKKLHHLGQRLGLAAVYAKQGSGAWRLVISVSAGH